MSNVFYFSGEVFLEQEVYKIKGTYHPGSTANYWDEDEGPQVTLQEARKWCKDNEAYEPPLDINEAFQISLERAAIDQEVYLQNQSE